MTILAFWVFGFAMMSHNLLNFYVNPKHRTCFLTWQSDFLRYFIGAETIFLIVILPLLLMICCYILLFKKLCHAKNFYKLQITIGSVENETLYNYKTARKFLFSASFRALLLLVVYSVSWIPTMTIWCSYVVKLSSIDIFDTWYNKIAEVMPFLNAAINPFLYGWSWFEFREAAKKNLQDDCIRILKSQLTAIYKLSNVTTLHILPTDPIMIHK